MQERHRLSQPPGIKISYFLYRYLRNRTHEIIITLHFNLEGQYGKHCHNLYLSEHGWHSLIPILNVYDICKIALKENVGLFTVLSVFFPIVLIYPSIQLAKAFGKGTGFGICLFLFSFVCYPILGFGDAEYIGPQ